MDSDMCNGVFAPVCSPEVCDVPRIPYYQDLVIGSGCVKQTNEKDSCTNVKFQIRIYRELLDVFGKLKVVDDQGETIIYSERLEAYHAPSEKNMVAIFHFDDPETESARELAVFASTPSCKREAMFYIYSAPLIGKEICIGGTVEDGTITIEESLVEQEH